MTRSFDLNALSALEALKKTVDRLRIDFLDEDLARDCAIKAWHLCDHVFKELGSNSQFPDLRALQNHAKYCCSELAYLQVICNETKHANPSKYRGHIEKTNNHWGDFSPDDFDSRDFDTPRLEIKLIDGQTIPYIDVVDRAVGFWSNFFDEYKLR